MYECALAAEKGGKSYDMRRTSDGASFPVCRFTSAPISSASAAQIDASREDTRVAERSSYGGQRQRAIAVKTTVIAPRHAALAGCARSIGGSPPSKF